MTYTVQFLTTLKQKRLCNECVTLKHGILKTIIIASSHCTRHMVVLIVCRSCIVLDCMTCESRVVKCIHNSVFKIQDRITGSLVYDWRTCSVCINRCNWKLFISFSLSYAAGFAKESKRDHTFHTDMSEANFYPILLLYNLTVSL